MREWRLILNSLSAALVLASFILHGVAAQEISFELIVDPNPPIYAYEWEQNPELIMIQAINFSADPVPVKLKGWLYNSAGDLLGETDDYAVPVVSLEPELSTLYPSEIVPGSALIFYGDFEDQIIRTNRIPEGEYLLCAAFLDPETFQPITPEQCASFFVQGYDPPFLVYPPDGISMTQYELDNSVFTWTPVSPEPYTFMPIYRFGLAELFPGQEPREALLSNPLIFEQLIELETQLPYPYELLPPSTTNNFVWSVQALNENLQPLTSGDGWSEPFIFIIQEDTIVDDTTVAKVPPPATVTKEPPPIIFEEEPPPTTIQKDTLVIPVTIEEDTTTTAGKEPPPGAGITEAEPRIVGDTVHIVEDSIPVPRMISRPEYPPTDEYPPVDEWPPPYEDEPPDTLTLVNDCGPALTKEPGIPISLGMNLSMPDKFKYPRAVPIRAEGIDLDYAVFHCIGCDGQGEFKKAVEDHVDRFTWKLEGPGSLNTPFDIQAIQNADDSLENIMARLEAINDSLRLIEEKLAGLPGKIAAAEQRLKDNEAQKKAKDTLLMKTKARRDSVLSVLIRQNDTIIAQKERIGQLQDSIAARQDLIDSLTGILSGDPSAEMLTKLEEIGLLQDELEQLKNEVDAKEREILDNGTELADAIREADSLLELSLLEYKSLRDRAESLSRDITDRDSQRLGNPLYREYWLEMRSWDLLVNQFVSLYQMGDTMAPVLAERQYFIKQQAVAAISMANPAIRQDRFVQFETSMTAFKLLLNGSCSHHSGGTLTGCLQASAQVKESSENFRNALDTLVRSTYLHDPGISAEQDSLRQLLQVLETSIENAKQQVGSRDLELKNAREEYVSEMNRLEEERQELQRQVTGLGDSLASQQLVYENLKQAREDTLNNNKEKYLAMVHHAGLSIASFNARINGHSDTLGRTIADSLESAAARDELIRQIKEQETFIERLEALRENLESLVEKYNQDKAWLENRKQALEAEKEDLLEKKEEFRKKKEQQFAGTKTAQGVLVYYIPPPLEEVMKNKAEFERLKEEVEMAEDTLQMAYDFKQLVQKRLVREIDKISGKLVKFKQTDELLTVLEENKEEIEFRLAEVKNHKKLEFQNYQSELQRILEEAREDKDLAEDQQESYENDSIVLVEDIRALKASLAAKDSLISQLQRSQSDGEAQVRYEKELLSNARATLEQRNEELASARNDRLRILGDLARARNDLTRAHAKEQVAEVRAAEQRIAELANDTLNIRQTIQSLQNQVGSALSSVESALLRVNNAEASLDEVLRQLSQARRERMEIEDHLIDKGEEMEEALSGLNHWRKVEEKARQLEDKTNKARQEFEGQINQQVNNDEEVVSLTKELENIAKATQDAEKAKTDIIAEINGSIARKDAIIDEAEAKLQQAKDRLEQREQELHDFVLMEFNTVSYSVRLELVGEDRVLDGFRYDDDGERLLNTLSYNGSRTPVMTNVEAAGSLPDIPMAGNCEPKIAFDAQAPPMSAMDPAAGLEPRTIALVYKEGRPLWPEWPVIPTGTPLIARDVVPVNTEYTLDMDQVRHTCVTQVADCEVPPPLLSSIVDLGRYNWSVEGTIINQHPLYNKMHWETPIIPRPYPEQPKNLRSAYNASMLAGDQPDDNEALKVVKPGVLIEVTDSLVGAPEEIDTVIARVVTGDHQGLSGEDIEFSLVRTGGSATEYGFDGTDTLKVVKTNEEGYAKVTFHYGKGFASFTIHAKWKREDNILMQDELEAISPIRLQFLKFSAGASAYAWEPAVELFAAGESVDEERLREAAARLDVPDPADSTSEVPVHALVGLLDEERDFVKEENVIFTPLGGITVDPDTAGVKAFGIARTEVKDLPKDAKVRLKASVEDKYMAVGRPGSDRSELSTTKVDRFKIGSDDNPFVIILDDPVSEGETVTGTGKLSAESGGDIILELLDISLDIHDVELEGDLENKKAISGSVSWSGSPGLAWSYLSFEFTLDSLAIYPARSAGIGGKLNHPSLTNSVEFYAELDPSGNFMGTVKELPQIEFLGFTLKQGTSFTLDMDRAKNPPGFGEEEFKGVVIHQIDIELPEVFNTNKRATPSVLSGKDLYIGTSGVGGTVGYEGTLLSLAFSGYAFEVDNVSITFENDSVIAASLGGKLALPSPFEGTISGTVSKAGNTWAVMVQTEDPVSIPRLATTFTLLPGTGAQYDEDTQVATFRLDAMISSEDYGDMTIKGFMIDSDGNIQAEEIAINEAIEIGSGFSIEVESLSFVAAQSEYMIHLKGGFSFPLIGVDELRGTVTVSPGPALDVTFDKAEISFQHGPVSFAGGFEYSGNEFKGEFGITLENLRAVEGIRGLLIVGNTLDQAQTSYTYWYAQMVLSGSVPLGQTGLFLLELGAGLGYNYNPPVGSQPGSPSNTGAFSFKAIIGIGTPMNGALIAGRMEMVLASGYFTLYGKLWLLDQEESMYGEGAISLFWAPENKFEGFVAMFVGIPDAQGDIFLFEGKINFLYAMNDKYIRSEKIEGSFLHALHANASVDITGEHIKMDGRLWYNLDKTFDVGIVALIVVINVDATTFFHYIHATSTLNTGARFHGDWDVDLDTPLGVADIISGAVDLALLLEATPSYIDVKGSASITWDVWFYSDSLNVNAGFRINI